MSNNLLIIILVMSVIILFYFYDGLGFSMANLSKEKTLYERLGGIYAIAAVVNHFSDAILDDPIAGMHTKNKQLSEWYKNQLDRHAGLKFMRTLWVAAITGGPYKYVPTKPGKCPFSLENAHSSLKISSEEFDAVAHVLANSLEHFKVPNKEKNEVLNAFAAHKSDVIKQMVNC